MINHTSDESVFNMALAYLLRIDKLLYKCQEAAIEQNIDNWRNYLRAVYRELSVKLDPKEKEWINGSPDDKTTIEELLNEYVTEEEATFLNINKLANNIHIRTKHKQKILFLLDALDVKIRSKLQQKGMLLPSKEDVRYAVTKR